MIIKLLGILDIFIGICFWIFGIFGWIPESFILLLGLFLLGKGIVFVSGLSFGSILDIIFSIVMIIGTSIVLPKAIVIIVSLFLLQKGIFSLLS